MATGSKYPNMAFAFRNTIRIAEPESFPGSELSKTLSIEFLPDGFVFSLMDAKAFKYIALEAFEVKNATNVSEFASQVAGFLEHNPLFSQSFAKAIVSVYSPYLVLAPGDVTDANKAGRLYSTCATLPEGHSLKTEPLHIFDACGIYPVPDKLIETCEKLFTDYQIRSYGVSMIKNVLASQKLEKWNADVIIHIKRTHAEVLLLKQDTLLFYRSFQISCFDDLLYYLFFVLEQYKMNAHHMNAVAMGELPMDSANFSVLASFFKDLSLPARNDAFKYGSGFESIPGHYYYNLLNLNTCE